jgi:hypothetical protein
LKEAHAAIYEAEKDILGQDPATIPEVAEVEEKAASLKSMIIQSDWKKADLSALVEGVKKATVILQQKLQEKEAQEQKLKVAKAKADEERKKQEEQKAKFGDTR